MLELVHWMVVCVYLRCSYDVPLVRASLLTSRAVRDQSGDPFRLRS